jgi:hypothetical protein
MIHEHSQWIERLAYLFAGVAAVSLSQAALLVTLLAGLASLILASIRIHDRLKYGRGGGE